MLIYLGWSSKGGRYPTEVTINNRKAVAIDSNRKTLQVLECVRKFMSLPFLTGTNSYSCMFLLNIFYIKEISEKVESSLKDPQFLLNFIYFG